MPSVISWVVIFSPRSTSNPVAEPFTVAVGEGSPNTAEFAGEVFDQATSVPVV
jgi:hypothetical protein